MSSAATATRVKVETGGKKLDLSTSKLKSVSGTHNHGVKGKAEATATKTTATATTTAVKAKSTKKVYTLPGQKYDVPEEREPLRIFYESLSQQIPTSEMAEFWMMEHGLLPPEKAKKAYERKQRKQHQLRTGTPVKPHKPPHKPERPESSKSHLLKNTNSGSKKRQLQRQRGRVHRKTQEVKILNEIDSEGVTGKSNISIAGVFSCRCSHS